MVGAGGTDDVFVDGEAVHAAGVDHLAVDGVVGAHVVDHEGAVVEARAQD